MEKNSTIETKIARYAAFAGATLSAGAANAQINYFDINPDIVLNNASTAIDINGDTQPDFVFMDTVYSATAGRVAVIPLGMHGVMGDSAVVGANTYFYPFQLNLNDPITATASWITNSNVGSLVWINNGTALGYGSHWQTGGTDKYLGMRVDLTGGNFMYGWIRVDLSADLLTLTIKDLGYNMTPNASINAGQGPISVSETISGKVSVYNDNNVLDIRLTDVVTNANLTVTGVNGQIVANETINGSSRINLNNLAAGIYVVNLELTDGIFTQKIVIQ